MEKSDVNILLVIKAVEYISYVLQLQLWTAQKTNPEPTYVVDLYLEYYL